jgi:phosphoglycerate dehydrogenase-like enzyme
VQTAVMVSGKMVALAGVGQLGVQIAASLQHAGYTVRGFDVSY